MNVGSWYVSIGRIDRKTYWLRYFLPLFVLSVIVEVVVPVASGSSLQAAADPDATAHAPAVLIWLPLVVGLLTACPSISSQVTRLHDRGHSAWWLLFNLLPLAGPIVLLVQMCLAGDAGHNRYGPPPGPLPLPDAPTPAAQN